MDPLYEEEIIAEEPKSIFNPIGFVLQFLASYGWLVVGAAAAVLYVLHRLRPHLERWREDREAAEYHKDPDKALARLEAIQRAREKQQQELLAASERALELQMQREDQKRLEAIERMEKYGKAAQGNRLGSEDDFLPLSGGASTSSYRAPKRSACSGGGCGR